MIERETLIRRTWDRHHESILQMLDQGNEAVVAGTMTEKLEFRQRKKYPQGVIFDLPVDFFLLEVYCDEVVVYSTLRSKL